MLQNIIVLSLLIAAVIALRLIFRKKVSARIIYALWIAVVIKLCMPFSLIPIIPQTVIPESVPTQNSTIVTDADKAGQSAPDYSFEVETQIGVTVPTPSDLTSSAVGQNSPAVETTPSTINPATPGAISSATTVGVEAAEVENTAAKASIDIAKVLLIAWGVCSAAVAAFFLANGTVFSVKLHRNRTYIGDVKHVKIYSTTVSSTPFVYGLIPSIYITPETKDSADYSFAVSHEWTHIRHGDNIWAIVRILALIAYPWNPLVWAAAILSKRDAEFACDEAVTSKMDRDEKLNYAQMLVDSVRIRPSGIIGLGSAPLKERIKALTESRKNRVIIAVIAIVLAVAVIIGSFIGFKKNISDTPAEETPLTTEGEVTVTSLDELKFYTDAGLFSQRQFDFYYDLISDDGEHEEFHSLVISPYAISFEPKGNELFKSNIEFTVIKSDLDALPVGEYHKELVDGAELWFRDIDKTEPSDDPDLTDGAKEAKDKICDFIRYSYIWNTPVYGEGTDYPGMYNYICTRYSDQSYYKTISKEKFCEVARAEFGCADPEDYLRIHSEPIHGVPGLPENAELYQSGDLAATLAYDITEVTEDQNSYTVVIQYYNDKTNLFASHKIAYKLGKDGKWLGYTIVKEGKYPPLSLCYIPDGNIKSVPAFLTPDNTQDEEVVLLASYGQSVGKTADGFFYAGTDGMRYDVVGIYNKKTREIKNISTHFVSSDGGNITSTSYVSRPRTEEPILSFWPPCELPEGKYRSKLFSYEMGVVERTIEVTSGGKIKWEERSEDNASFVGRYEGTIKFDENIGETVITLTSAANNTVTVKGRLSGSYVDFYYFTPMESELESLSVDFPIPLVLTAFE